MRRQVCWVVFVLLLLLASSCGEIPTPRPVGQTPATPVEDYPGPPTSAPKPARTPSPTDTPRPTTVAPTPAPTTVPPTPLPPYVPEEELPANLPTIVYAVRRPEQAVQVWTLRHEKGVLQEELLVDLSPAVLERKIDPAQRFIGSRFVEKLSVSPDGRYVGLTLVETDGYSEVPLIVGVDGSKYTSLPIKVGYILDWTPDSKRIIMTTQFGDPSWGAINIDGTDAVGFPKERVVDAVSTPDGSRVIFSTLSWRDIWIGAVDIDGGNLAHFPVPDPLPGHRIQNLTLSPDSQSCAFTWSQNPTYYGGGPIWTMDIDGLNQRPLGPGDTRDFDLAWSPDGRSIAFSRREDTEEIYHTFDRSQFVSSLWLIDVESGEERLLFPSEDQYSSWSPNGSPMILAWSFSPTGEERSMPGLSDLTAKGCSS